MIEQRVCTFKISELEIFHLKEKKLYPDDFVTKQVMALNEQGWMLKSYDYIERLFPDGMKYMIYTLVLCREKEQ